MKITTLMENTASAECYTAEHGLSIFIETKNRLRGQRGKAGR